MQRISIIGISASGKSTFSRKLSEITNLPLFHMDNLFWKGNWEEVPEKEYLEKHAELIQQESWIIEGYIDSKMADRLTRSDLIIFLDYSGWFCAWRVIKRWLKHRKISRPELPKEATEKLKGSFLWRVFMRKERECIEQALQGCDIQKLHIVHSPKELDIFTEKYFKI